MIGYFLTLLPGTFLAAQVKLLQKKTNVALIKNSNETKNKTNRLFIA